MSAAVPVISSSGQGATPMFPTVGTIPADTINLGAAEATLEMMCKGIWYTHPALETVTTGTSSSRGTVIFKITKWSEYLNEAAKFWIMIHDRVQGSIDYQIILYGSQTMLGAINAGVTLGDYETPTLQDLSIIMPDKTLAVNEVGRWTVTLASVVESQGYMRMFINTHDPANMKDLGNFANIGQNQQPTFYVLQNVPLQANFSNGISDIYIEVKSKLNVDFQAVMTNFTRVKEIYQTVWPASVSTGIDGIVNHPVSDFFPKVDRLYISLDGKFRDREGSVDATYSNIIGRFAGSMQRMSDSQYHSMTDGKLGVNYVEDSRYPATYYFKFYVAKYTTLTNPPLYHLAMIATTQSASDKKYGNYLLTIDVENPGFFRIQEFYDNPTSLGIEEGSTFIFFRHSMGIHPETLIDELFLPDMTGSDVSTNALLYDIALMLSQVQHEAMTPALAKSSFETGMMTFLANRKYRDSQITTGTGSTCRTPMDMRLSISKGDSTTYNDALIQTCYPEKVTAWTLTKSLSLCSTSFNLTTKEGEMSTHYFWMLELTVENDNNGPNCRYAAVVDNPPAYSDYSSIINASTDSNYFDSLEKVPERATRVIFTPTIPNSVTPAVAIDDLPTTLSLKPNFGGLPDTLWLFDLQTVQNRQVVMRLAYSNRYETFYGIFDASIPSYCVYNSHQGADLVVINVRKSTIGNFPGPTSTMSFISRITDPTDVEDGRIMNDPNSHVISRIKQRLLNKL